METVPPVFFSSRQNQGWGVEFCGNAKRSTFMNEIYDDRLAYARRWATRNALKLIDEGLTPIDAAGVLIGAAVGILTTAFDNAKAVEFFLGVAADLEGESRRRFETETDA